MTYLTIKELKELIKDMPDDGQIYFDIVREDEELYWRDNALVRTGKVDENCLSLTGKRVTWQEENE